jgi:aminomethyltransferase
MDPEYFAIRHGVGLIDVSPLYKYEVKGKDAARFLSRVMVKDLGKLKIGRVTYLCWCDDHGKVIDDGTVTRLGEEHYRVSSAEPAFGWFSRLTAGLKVTVEDISTQIATLSVQGPNSRGLLNEVTDGAVAKLRYFGATKAKIAGVEVNITRTGYTGDLGFEVWTPAQDATKVYEAILGVGEKNYGALPVGLDAMDVTRVEAGYILNGVDYFTAPKCFVESRQSTPYEIGLGWCVELDREPFIGQRALAAAAKEKDRLELVGLDVSWVEMEKLFSEHGLPPELPTHAWRDGRPVYDQIGDFIGKATSGAWSPTLKKNLALASVPSAFSAVGTELRFEVTVEYRRCQVPAVVTEMPFFNPARKRD